MSENVCFSHLAANLSRLIATATIEATISSSLELKENCKTKIRRLSEIRAEIVEEERKYSDMVRDYQKRINALVKEYEIPKQEASSSSRKRTTSSSNDLGALALKRRKIDEDSFPLTDIPPLLRDAIMEKFDYKDFTVFDQCSKLSHGMCKDTKQKFPLKTDSVRFEEDLWKFQSRPGVRRNIVATMEQMNNVMLDVRSLTIKKRPEKRRERWNIDRDIQRPNLQVTITEELCLFLMAQVKAKCLTCDEGFNCPSDLFTQMVETLGLEELNVNLNDDHADLSLNMSRISYVCLSDANGLSTETILQLKPLRSLFIQGRAVTEEELTRKIERMILDGGYELSFMFCDGLNFEMVSGVMESFGPRAELAEGTRNCWTVANRSENIPSLWVVFTPDVVELMGRDAFYRDFERFAEFP